MHPEAKDESYFFLYNIHLSTFIHEDDDKITYVTGAKLITTIFDGDDDANKTDFNGGRYEIYSERWVNDGEGADWLFIMLGIFNAL